MASAVPLRCCTTVFVLVSSPNLYMLSARALCSLSAAPRRPHPRRASHRVAASAVRKVNAEELEVTVGGRTKPIVVDFYARHGCGVALREKRGDDEA